MLEVAENLIQASVLAVCTLLAGHRYRVSKNKAWMLLTLFYAGYLLGDLYWLLMLVLFDRTPVYSYVSEISWFASFQFLYLLTRYFLDRDDRSPDRMGNRKMSGKNDPVRKLLWTGPVFAICMGVFYMQWEDYICNTAYAIIMAMILWRSSLGLLMLKGQSLRENRTKRLYLAVNGFCLIEYGLWTVSCFWGGETLRNPYYWIEILMAVWCVVLLISTGGAVRESADELY